MNLMQNEKFKKIISEVDTDWSIEERVRYVLQKLGICDETIIHIVTAGVKTENLDRYTLWQESGFLENLDEKCKELSDAINNWNNDIEANWTVEERLMYELQKLGCNESIIRIIMAGAKIANLYENTLLEKSEFLQDFQELYSAINTFIEKQDADNKIGIITFIRTLQENIMKSNEIKRVICLFQ